MLRYGTIWSVLVQTYRAPLRILRSLVGPLALITLASFAYPKHVS